jgi:hypothetical protein
MRRAGVPSLLVLALAFSACQTIVVKSHRDPSAGKLAFDRALAVVNLSGYEDSERIRRAGEMELVNGLPELNLVPSYLHFSLEELADRSEAKRRAAAEGFDGLVLLRVKEVRTGRAYDRQVAGPEGFTSEDGEPWLDVLVSAAVMSVAEDRPAWRGVIERRDDKGTKSDVRAIVRAVARQLRADGLVK